VQSGVEVDTPEERAAFILRVETGDSPSSKKSVKLLPDYTVSHTSATFDYYPVSACFPGPLGLDKYHPLAVPRCVYSETKFLSSKFARNTQVVHRRLPRLRPQHQAPW
jgi:hypothetical protein